MSTGSRRVAVAISGGVDSAVTAAILKNEGYKVTGVTMKLWKGDAGKLEFAREVCQALEIPFYVIDFETQFQAGVIDYFCREYLRGRTPNPCVRCNEKIKFGLLLDSALEMGADYLATGHYARIEKSNGDYLLLKATDHAKDQSYLLYTLNQSELTHLLLPLGRFRKSQVRRMAQQMGLGVWERPESQEICFIPDNDYRSFLAGCGSPRPGDIIDTAGKVLGRHSGIGFYTVGQRRGLRLASREPLYIIEIDPSCNRLVVGTEKQLHRDELYAGEVSLVNGDPPQNPIAVTAKIRYGAPGAKAMLYIQGRNARLIFEEPQKAIAPGQAVVFYKGEEVLGGGTIEPDDRQQGTVRKA